MSKNDDTISRQDAIKAIRKSVSKSETEDSLCFNLGLGVAEKAVNSLPSAEPKTGKWIVNISDYESVCSVCGAKETDFIYGTEMWYGLGESNYCPNCGARMMKNGKG